jgi:hypothetical protein
MDCEGCESYELHPGRTSGDPDQCYPDEAVCKENAPESGPCKRMLGAINNVICDGCLETAHGQFYTSAYLQDAQKDDDAPESFRNFSFSSASFWWVPNNYDVAHAKAFNDEEEVFYAWFI